MYGEDGLYIEKMVFVLRKWSMFKEVCPCIEKMAYGDGGSCMEMISTYRKW